MVGSSGGVSCLDSWITKEVGAMFTSFVRRIGMMSLSLVLSTTWLFAQVQSKTGKAEAPDFLDGPLTRIQWVMTTPGALIVKDSYRIAVRTTFGMTVAALVV